jgi:hypothetical protein
MGNKIKIFVADNIQTTAEKRFDFLSRLCYISIRF